MKYPVEKYPLITVIMPVLNSVETIKKAFDSVIAQNYPNVELMVMDGASVDGTIDIIKEYKPHIAYFRSRVDGGNAEAQNEARRLCKGDIISLLCADDFFEPETFIKVAEAFIENPAADLVNVRGRMVSKDGREYTTRHVDKLEDLPISSGNVRMLNPNCRFFKKHLFEKYGDIIESIEGKPAIASDYEYIVRFSLYNPVNINLGHIGYSYLGHQGSLTFNTNKYTKLKLYDQKVYYVEQILQNHADVIPDVLKAKLYKEYKRAFERRVIKNLVDGDYKLFLKNLRSGVSKFGYKFVFGVARFGFSYTFRLSKKVRAMRKKLKRR